MPKNCIFHTKTVLFQSSLTNSPHAPPPQKKLNKKIKIKKKEMIFFLIKKKESTNYPVAHNGP